MEPNPGDIYNEGYEAGYKAGKADTEEAVKAERVRHLNDLIRIAERLVRNEVTVDEYLVRWREMLQALTPTKTDKQTDV